jgi:CBS domain containing-hemolysin-like protein
MLFSLWLYRWLIWALNGTGNWLLRRVGVESHGHRHVHSPEELEQIVSHGTSLDARQAERLRRVFRFGDRTIRDAVVPRLSMATLPVEAGWDQAMAALARHGYTRYPVLGESDDHVLGLLHVKDLLGLDRGQELDLREHLRKMPVLPATVPLSDALQQLRDENAQMALVLDEYGGTFGLVTAEDLMEEVVGEIHDEFDRSRASGQAPEPGCWLVRGELPLADLRSKLGLPEQLPDVHTLGGLILHHLGRRPVVDDVVELAGLKFRAAEVRGARIVRVEITGGKG